jgi:uncharacterized protein
MDKEVSGMEIDLGAVRDRWEFTFRGFFTVPDHDGDERRFDAVVNGSVTRMGSRLLLEAAVSGKLRVECSRCISIFDMPLETEVAIVFHRGQVPEDADEDDLVLLTETDASGYDILPRVREAVILELPIRFLCGDSCKGLCSGCGVNLNEGDCECPPSEPDPRWRALKNLLNDDPKR